MKKKIFNTILIMILTTGIAYAASLTVQSDKQEFVDSDNKIYLEGNVNVKSGDINVVSPKAIVNIDPKNHKVNSVEFTDKAYSYQMTAGKNHEIKAEILNVSLLNKVFTAEGNTISSVTENNRPLVIVTADKQQYNKITNVMKAFGKVNILYKNIDTLSDTAYVDLTKDNDVKKIELIGNSRLKQDKSTICANKLTYDNITEDAIAVGDVYTDIITEDNKQIKIWSDYQAYDKAEKVITASGSTKIVYEDYVATGPKVNVFPDKTTGKLNEAVFVGRSKIETKGRTIEADRITITMNPKDFKAEGNVRSVIPNIGN